MGRVVSLHARLAEPQCQSDTLPFGQDWKARCPPEEFLEFSEYARDRDRPRGVWLALILVLGLSMWALLVMAIL
ncbi:MAG TPA: hypothetical protein VG891_06440 [Rhizomicrobium sp.]|nr:hypothetical protein [Rhizomicrobium sp.]